MLNRFLLLSENPLSYCNGCQDVWFQKKKGKKKITSVFGLLKLKLYMAATIIPHSETYYRLLAHTRERVCTHCTLIHSLTVTNIYTCAEIHVHIEYRAMGPNGRNKCVNNCRWKSNLPLETSRGKRERERLVFFPSSPRQEMPRPQQQPE